MTKEELAEKLNGCEIGDEVDTATERLAKNAGLVIVFGASDDLVEFCGAIHDEAGCYGGGIVWIDSDGLMKPHDECGCYYCGYEEAKAKAVYIQAVWGKDGYSWTYRTKIPHEGFDVLEDGRPYCRGIVFEKPKA